MNNTFLFQEVCNMLCSIEKIHAFNVEFDCLRFMNPDGDIIVSQERHLHDELIREDQLSNLSGFSAIIDICQKGFAILCPDENDLTLTISYIVALNQKQSNAIEVLKNKYGCQTVLNLETDF